MTTTSNQSIRVFLCHTSNDKPSVRRLYKKLVEDKIDVWFDEEKLLPGQEWDVEIQKAVRISDVVIICLSNESVTKEGYVQKEIKIALDVAEEKPEGTIFIIPVRLEDCSVPHRIKRWQWIDLFLDRGEISIDKYQKLLDSLEVRSNQLGLLLTSVSKNIDFLPEINSLTTSPPRAWIMPIEKNILVPAKSLSFDEKEVFYQAKLIQQELASLNLPGLVSEISRGPRFTRFGVEPLYKETKRGNVKVSIAEFESIADDLALSLGLGDITVHAPIPGQKIIGIDVKNKQVIDVSMLEIIESGNFDRNNQFNIVLGRDVVGNPVVIDLLSLPNVLIAGRPYSGKSNFIDVLVSCLMLENNPNDLQFVLVDKRKLEFSIYRDSLHLLLPILSTSIEIDNALNWLLQETEDRKKLFSKVGARTFKEYNSIAEFGEKIPFIVLIISELHDLVVEKNDRDREKFDNLLPQLLGLARITGVQVFISTQHSKPEIITPRLKSNIATQIAFATTSIDESMAIIDQPGAERLAVGGDALYLDKNKRVLNRIQTPLISDDEILNLIKFWRQQIF